MQRGTPMGNFPWVDLLLYIACCLPKSILFLYSIRVLAVHMLDQLETTFPSLLYNQIFANRIWVEELGEFSCHYLSLFLLLFYFLGTRTQTWWRPVSTIQTRTVFSGMAEPQMKGTWVLTDRDEKLCPASQGQLCRTHHLLTLRLLSEREENIYLI